MPDPWWASPPLLSNLCLGRKNMLPAALLIRACSQASKWWDVVCSAYFFAYVIGYFLFCFVLFCSLGKKQAIQASSKGAKKTKNKSQLHELVTDLILFSITALMLCTNKMRPKNEINFYTPISVSIFSILFLIHFFEVLIRRICWKIKTFFTWKSFL